MLIEEQYELFSGASPLSEPFLIEPNKEEFEDLPSKYFENDEVRWVVTQMVRPKIPKFNNGAIKINKKTNKPELVKSNFHSKFMEELWKKVTELDIPFKVIETKNQNKGQFGGYNGNSLEVRIFTNLNDYQKSLKYVYSDREDFAYVSVDPSPIANSLPSLGLNMTNIQLNCEEFYYLYQFINGKIWFENNGGWQIKSDINNEAEAKKKACSIYMCSDFWVGSPLKADPKTLRLTPSITQCYRGYFNESEIATQLVSGIKKVLRIIDVKDGVVSQGELEIPFQSSGYTNFSNKPPHIDSPLRDGFRYQFPFLSNSVKY